MIVGTPRSGTLELTRILNLCGAALPAKLSSPAGKNRSGHCEPETVTRIHEDVLRSIGSSIDDIAPLPGSWLSSGPAADAKVALHDFLLDELFHASLFVVTDPHLCTLLPLWNDPLVAVRADPRFVMAVRHPLEVAELMSVENGRPTHQNLLVWLKHVLNGERNTRHRRRVLTTYDDCVDWRGMVDNVSAALGLSLPPRSFRVETAVDRFVRQSVRHHAVSDDAFVANPEVAEWVSAAYNALQHLDDDEMGAIATLEDIRQAWLAADSEFDPVVAALETGMLHGEQETSADPPLSLGTSAVEHVAEGSQPVQITSNGDANHARLLNLCAELMEHDRDLAVLFDVEFYLGANPGVAHGPADALAHYLSVGFTEGRDPSPLFDTDYYLAANLDVAGTGTNPLVHFLLQGAMERRRPNALFDVSDYVTSRPEGVQGRNPLAHYVTTSGIADVIRRARGGGASWGPLTKQLALTSCEYTRRRAGPAPTSASGRAPDSARRDGEGVLVVSHDAELNGAQLIALSAAREMSKGHRAAPYILLRRGGSLAADFAALAPTIVLDDPSRIGSGEFDRLLDGLWQLGVRSALCNTMVAGDIAAALKDYGFRVVTAIHELPGAVHAYGSERLLRQAIESADDVVFPARFVEERMLASFHLAPRRSWIAAQGIIRPNPFLGERSFARLQLSKSLGIPDDAVVIMGCGLTSQRKGFDLFVLAAAAALRRCEVALHFVWVGPIDESFAPWCLHDIANSGLSDRIHLAGSQRHAGLYFAASDLFLLPSREDPLPTVCLEALESGLPVIAFDEAGGIGEIIEPDAGMLVPYLDVEAMADAVIDLALDDERRAVLGRAGRAIALELSVEKYVEFLTDLLLGREGDHG